MKGHERVQMHVEGMHQHVLNLGTPGDGERMGELNGGQVIQVRAS